MPLSLGIAHGAGFLKNPAEPAALGYRVNYIPNPSFEVDLTGWDELTGATVTRVTSQSVNGSAAAQVVTTAASGFQWGNAALGGKIAYDKQGSYYASAYVKADAGAGSSVYSVRYYEYESDLSTSTVGSGVLGATTIVAADGWVRIGGTWTRTTAANNVIIRVFSTNIASGHTFYVDSVMMEHSSTLGTYFDGDTNGFWSGTAHNSNSGATPY